MNISAIESLKSVATLQASLMHALPSTREQYTYPGSNFHYCIDTHACNLSQFRITAAVSRVRLFQIQAPISSHSIRR